LFELGGKLKKYWFFESEKPTRGTTIYHLQAKNQLAEAQNRLLGQKWTPRGPKINSNMPTIDSKRRKFNSCRAQIDSQTPKSTLTG